MGLWAGCAGPGPATKFVECPLSVSEQQQAVLDVVPAGTSRDEAERRLKAAGIDASPGGNGSIYYIALWKRSNGEHWHMNVALLFDKAGKLYQTRAANASTGIAEDAELPAEDATADRRKSSTVSAPPDAAWRKARPEATSDDETERVPFPGQRSNPRGNTP